MLVEQYITFCAPKDGLSERKRWLLEGQKAAFGRAADAYLI